MSIQNERFTVIFNTRGSNVLSIGVPDEPAANVELTPAVIESNNNYNTVTYNVNWLSILPTKYKKFQCSFVFKSDKFDPVYTEMAVIDFLIIRDLLA